MRQAIFRSALPFVLVVATVAQNHRPVDRLQCVATAAEGMASAEEFAEGKAGQKEPAVPVNLDPGNAEEAARFLQAPHGAKRTGKRQLEVSWAKGRKLFKDKPPYDEPLDGVWWEYCGYSPTLKLHLIGKMDRDLFTGTLLDEITGMMLPGGKIVSFSPDHQFYLASRGFADDHPDLLQVVLSEIAEVDRWAATHQEEVAHLLSPRTGISVESLKIALARLSYGVTPLDDSVIAEQQRIADSFHELGLIPTRISVRDAVWTGPKS